MILRYTILALSAAAAVAGLLIILGFLVPRNLPDEFRVIIGVVIFLYGLYRFAITYFKHGRR